jgi:hypothetical protein
LSARAEVRQVSTAACAATASRFEQLTKGDIRTIEAGGRFIHSLFHLEHPSISLVVRTHLEPDRCPQLSYRPPFIAIDPFVEDRLREQRIQLLRMIEVGHPTLLAPLLFELAATQDLPSLFHILSALTASDPGFALLPDLIETARQRHGELSAVLLPVAFIPDDEAGRVRRSDHAQTEYETT